MLKFQDYCIQCPWPQSRSLLTHAFAVGAWQPRASLAQSLMGSLLLSPRSWCTQGFVCALENSVSPVLWKFCNQIPLAFKVIFPGGSQSLCQIPRLGNLLWCLELLKQCKNFCGIIFLQFMGFLFSGSIVGLMVTSSKKTYATSFTFHDHNCCQSPCLCGRPQLTCAYTGDTKTLKGRSGSVSCGGHCSFPWVLVHTRFCLCLLSMKFDSKLDYAPPTILLGLFLCTWTWGIFFWWDPTFSC